MEKKKPHNDTSFTSTVCLKESKELYIQPLLKKKRGTFNM